MLRPQKPNSPAGEPEGSDDFIEVTLDKEQCLCNHYSAPVTPLPLAYTPPPPVLATMEPLDTFLMGDEVISTIFERENDEFIKSSVDDFDEPSSNSDSVPRSYDEFEDISILDPPESTLVIDDSSLLVTSPPASKQLSLREVERFDPIFSLTQSGGMKSVMETPSFSFYHMPLSSPRPAAYSPKEVMYCYYHPHLTSGDGLLDHGSKMK
ncbi:hypothetical protein Tco_1306592 [Tanacetum coccineum]